MAVELAKAGVSRLDVFDCDDYDLNNTVRHVLGGELAANRRQKQSLPIASDSTHSPPLMDIVSVSATPTTQTLFSISCLPRRRS